MNSIEIINPGLLTTVQDLGRWGYQQFGMPVSGVMDEFSHKCANALVGNKEGSATLEITLIGPEIRFNQKTSFAVTGADFNLSLNDKKIHCWTYNIANKGDTLKFGRLNSGTRAYLAIGGEILTEEIMGSRSTYLRGKLGGHEGRAMKKGDILTIGKRKRFLRKPYIPTKDIPNWYLQPEIRILKGVNYDSFAAETIQGFERRFYCLQCDSDRMGYRLKGTPLNHNECRDILSYGISKGAIQIPGDGLPIIMMSDSQTTGGYTQIANIISADLFRVAQLKPGDYLKFKFVEYKEAVEALLLQNKILRKMSSLFL